MFAFSTPEPYDLADAAVAQLVECELPKLEVAGSTPVRRSKFDSHSTIRSEDP